MKVQKLITELSNFPTDKEVRLFHYGGQGMESELTIVEHDQDDKGNPTFMLEYAK